MKRKTVIGNKRVFAVSTKYDRILNEKTYDTWEAHSIDNSTLDTVDNHYSTNVNNNTNATNVEIA